MPIPFLASAPETPVDVPEATVDLDPSISDQWIIDSLMTRIRNSDDPLALIERARAGLAEVSPQRAMPIDHVRWIPLNMVEANEYNPNSVAKTEMGLLATSIRHDGYTQPVVTVYDKARGKYVIIDGFHRYFTMKTNKDVFDATGGLLPCVVLDKDINDRMASTVRHNRARGKHSVQGMSNMVFEMLQNGWEDAAICNELGMAPEELLRLKHITGFSKLFADREYNRSWVTERQVLIAREYNQKERQDDPK